jgi:hypothetical protein
MPPLTAIERELLGAIADGDDHARRVLADYWLQGDDPARGELVQLQLEGQNVEPLLAKHGKRWLWPAIAMGISAKRLTFDRGFAPPLVLTDADAIDDAMFRLSPRHYRWIRDAYLGISEATALTVARAKGRFALKYAVRITSDEPGVEREAAVLSCIDHPNVVRFREIALQREGPALVLDWAGDSVFSRMRRTGGRLGEILAITVGIQLCDALVALQAHGIVHGRIEPLHVLVDDGGRATLINFDRAECPGAPPVPKRPRAGTLRGKISQYLTPEQALGEPVGPATDVFSLCHLLFAMVAGRSLVRHLDTEFERLTALRDCQFALRPTTPLFVLLSRNLVRDPRARMSAEALGKALSALLRGG